jgi:hypothetical protein
MTRIAPTATQATPALPTDAAASPLSATHAATAPTAATALTQAAAAPQVMAAAFERLRASAALAPNTPVEHLVGEAVRSSLEAQFAGLGDALQQKLAGQITQILLDDPGTRLRLERLMGTQA